eukprot:GHVU01078528.1.p1 GENE.GHVU01078528.1~~GHVU01078528.1.p1  ORF type:complete len:161 (+),score=15.85 GHVU01078528.1:1677-2159(+)
MQTIRKPFSFAERRRERAVTPEPATPLAFIAALRNWYNAVSSISVKAPHGQQRMEKQYPCQLPAKSNKKHRPFCGQRHFILTPTTASDMGGSIAPASHYSSPSCCALGSADTKALLLPIPIKRTILTGPRGPMMRRSTQRPAGGDTMPPPPLHDDDWEPQ